MIQLQHILNNREDVIKRLAVKHFDAEETINEIIKIDGERRKAQTQLDGILAQINAASKEIGQLIAKGKKEEAELKKKEAADGKEETSLLQAKKTELENQLHAVIVKLPNLPHSSVPPGKTPEENVVVREGGKEINLDKDAKPHWELASQYKIIDFELGN